MLSSNLFDRGRDGWTQGTSRYLKTLPGLLGPFRPAISSGLQLLWTHFGQLAKAQYKPFLKFRDHFVHDVKDGLIKAILSVETGKVAHDPD